MIVITVVLAAAPIYALAGSGVVIESATAGGYTYVNVESNGQSFWIAGPQTAVQNGSRISFSEQIWMKDFNSKALGRSFDKILFVGGISAAAAAPAQKGALSPAPAPGPVKTCTVEELFTKRDELQGKVVEVKGKVVKVSSNIMGRNWVHITDGTGSAGSNKIIFRSAGQSASVGSEVTARGRLETAVDFGFGYRYDVIVEDASFRP